MWNPQVVLRSEWPLLLSSREQCLSLFGKCSGLKRTKNKVLVSTRHWQRIWAGGGKKKNFLSLMVPQRHCGGRAEWEWVHLTQAVCSRPGVEGTKMNRATSLPGRIHSQDRDQDFDSNFMTNCVCIQLYAFGFPWEALHRLQKICDSSPRYPVWRMFVLEELEAHKVFFSWTSFHSKWMLVLRLGRMHQGHIGWNIWYWHAFRKSTL